MQINVALVAVADEASGSLIDLLRWWRWLCPNLSTKEQHTESGFIPGEKE